MKSLSILMVAVLYAMVVFLHASEPITDKTALQNFNPFSQNKILKDAKE